MEIVANRSIEPVCTSILAPEGCLTTVDSSGCNSFETGSLGNSAEG
ncbi:hypothetical protein JXI42_05020 [bacterium]|nr:hypothetical protein [bacterium]